MWPLGRRADRTHTLFRAHSSQSGSANRYRWLAPRPTLAVKTCPTRRPFPPPTLARAHGTAHGRPAVGDASATTDAYPSSHAASHGMLRMPDVAAPPTPHSARAHTGPSRSLPSIGLQVQLYSCTTTQLQTLSPSAPRRERQVERLLHVVAGDGDVDVVRPHEIGVDAWLRTPLECAHGEG